MTQKENILKYLNDFRGWIFNYQLLGKKTKYGWLGSQADRRARELCGEVGDSPSFEYEGEYRGIKYLIRGRLIQRCRQYCVKIIDGKALEGNAKKTNLDISFEKEVGMYKPSWDNLGLKKLIERARRTNSEFVKRQVIEELG